MYDNRLQEKKRQITYGCQPADLLQKQRKVTREVTKMQKEEIDHGKSFI